VPITPEAQQILLAGGHRPQPSMVSLDEPEHARLRKPAARVRHEAGHRHDPGHRGDRRRTARRRRRPGRVRPGCHAGLPAARQYRVLPHGCARERPSPGSNTGAGTARLPAGARLFLWLAAAGWDAAAFTEPDRFELHRPDAERHLAFGKGLHFCLGANLGKLEAQVAVAELARRYPRLRLVPDQELTFHPNISFRGPQALRVRMS
jgi:cytochrome P450